MAAETIIIARSSGARGGSVRRGIRREVDRALRGLEGRGRRRRGHVLHRSTALAAAFAALALLLGGLVVVRVAGDMAARRCVVLV